MHERRGRRSTPYLLIAPGVAFLGIFFVIPLLTLGGTALEVGVGGFGDALSAYSTQFLRSFRFAALATLTALVIGYPLAYVIAIRAGRLKNLLLGLVMLPFLTTYLVRTLGWRTLLADQGVVVEVLRSSGVLGVLAWLGFVDGQARQVMATDLAVIGGLTYNFLPFMVLPIYVSLEKLDRRLLEAGRDLYATGGRVFRKVVLPLSLPGLFAGSLLTFIPASGDFVNAALLGGANQSMIGNVIQDQFLVVRNYPLAAALSFVLMAIILVMVLVYARLLGTEELM